MEIEIFVGELIGTAMLIVIGNGIVANQVLAKTKGNDTGWMLITVGWGLAVAISVYCVNRFSGAHLNPAVTLGLYSINELASAQVATYLIAQMFGAFLGAILVWLSYFSHWGVTDDADAKLAVFSTGPAIRAPIPNLFCEFMGTLALVFGILAIAANDGELDTGSAGLFGTGIKPLLVGGLVAVIGMGLGGPTGFAINPARDLGPRIAHQLLPLPGKRDSDWSYAWIPVVGPALGGVAGALLFQMMDGLGSPISP